MRGTARLGAARGLPSYPLRSPRGSIDHHPDALTPVPVLLAVAAAILGSAPSARAQEAPPTPPRPRSPCRCGDGKWLGGLCHGDVDPRIAGAELYTGGQNGTSISSRRTRTARSTAG